MNNIDRIRQMSVEDCFLKRGKMADIELVIKISEEDRDRIKDMADVFDSLTSRAYKAIRNGTPLPEHHGRLIDEDEIIIPSLSSWADQAMVADTIKDTPTILEAEEVEE